jgi:hypothetical protein
VLLPMGLSSPENAWITMAQLRSSEKLRNQGSY